MEEKMKNKLMSLALSAKEKAYAPFSNFKVGAALLTESGEIYTGVNVENSSYGLTICAERTAAVKAVSEGQKIFKAIAIASDSETPASPCGACRQFLWEFGDFPVILVSSKGNVKEYMLSELIPEGFRLKAEQKG